MCQSGVAKHVGLVQSKHHHLIDIEFVPAIIYPKNCSLGMKQHSLTNSLYMCTSKGEGQRSSR
jgi:hypothetical protein